VAGIGDVGRVVALRAMLREGFDALATGRPLATELLAEINALIGQVRVALTVEMTSASRTGAQLVTRETIAQDPVAVAVALDFARFVTDAEPDRLHHCANEECVVVFHDHGKNKTRRWCSMAGCGNRHKVARHRKRQRQSE
jgi:predicted RNA-binding Zn ribbon-like protein